MLGASMKAAIAINNLTKVFKVPSIVPWRKAGKIKALDGASFTCPAGKITCLLGPNGAGKTTLIKILAGIVLPDAGEVDILGTPLSQVTLNMRGKIGLLTPNERSFYWRLTGRQNIDFFAALHGYRGTMKRTRTNEVLSQVALEAEADKPFRLYSAGMKQRLLLARALLGRPEVILLDEPTTHLDPIARDGLHNLIQEDLVGKRGATVLMCTQDLSEAQKLADNLVLLDKGRVLMTGSLTTIRRKLQANYRILLEFEKLPNADWLETIPVLDCKQTASGLEMEVAELSIVPEIIKAAVMHEGRLSSCTHYEKPLPEIFAQVAGGRAC